MNTLLFLGSIGTSEILLIAFVVLLLFGGKKIPELMRGIGKGVRNFKEGVNGIEKDINKDIEIKLKEVLLTGILSRHIRKIYGFQFPQPLQPLKIVPAP